MKKLILLFISSLVIYCVEPLYAADADAGASLTTRTATSIWSRGYFRLLNSQGLVINDAYSLEGIHKISDSTDTPLVSHEFDTSGIFSKTLTVWNVTPGKTYVAEMHGCGKVTQVGDNHCDSDMTFYTVLLPPPPRPQPDPIEDREEDCGESPIVIDLDNNWFRFTDVEDGVTFDITADRVPESIAWTEADVDDAFLALDRNANGTIDNGAELFGNHTPQPATEHPNGYEALAVYDATARGGNQDGSITTADAVFTELLLWTDTNKNGTSEPVELTKLADSSVESISLNYRSSRRQDQHGNKMRYLSKVYLNTGHWVWSTDVFFLVRE